MEKKRRYVPTKIIAFMLLCVSGLPFFSCATKSDVYKEIDHEVNRENFKAGVAAIEHGQKRKEKPVYHEKNAVSLFLDKGLLEHYAGNYEVSSQNLQEAERLIQEAFTKSITADVASFVVNDNTKEYPGEDFEDIYINIFNALNYYNRGDIEGAMVEIRKLTISSGKLDMLSRKYEDARQGLGDGVLGTLNKFGISMNDALPQGDPVNFSNSALARYLSVLFYLADGNTDGARIELEQLQTAFKSNAKVYYNSVPQSVAELQNVPDGKARLNVIGFSGLSPNKEEGKFIGAFPFFANKELWAPVFKLPKMVKRPSRINRIEVVTEGHGSFDLELLEDMGAVVEETYNARFANIFFKTFIRVLLKYSAVDIAATAAAEKGGDWANLARLGTAAAGRITADATEAADIRMSRYMPDKAYVGGINLDPGIYNVTVHYYSGNQHIAKNEYRNVYVRAKALNLIEAVSLR